jgi:hypothetical protein
LDIGKAFDTTWNCGLLYKLSELKFSTSSIKLITSFLTDRKFIVLVEPEFSTSREKAIRVPPGSVLAPVLYRRCPRGAWNSSCSVSGWFLYVRDRETQMSCSLQTATRPHCSKVVVWALEHKDREGEIQAIYFTRRLRVPDDVLQLNGRDNPFVNIVKYLGVTFHRMTTWRHHTEMTVAKALHTYVRTYYSLFKSKRLSANIKLTLYKALIRSVMTYALDAHLLKLQRLQMTGAHRSANCTWLSKFHTCTVT